MKNIINRYSLTGEFILQGILNVESGGQSTRLTYTDSEIEEFSNELYHPIIALESLRKILETKHQSFINCNGCRIDSAYRETGGWGTYILTYGKQATESVNLFDSTDEITKLCTVDSHKAAYKVWLGSLGNKK